MKKKDLKISMTLKEILTSTLEEMILVMTLGMWTMKTLIMLILKLKTQMSRNARTYQIKS